MYPSRDSVAAASDLVILKHVTLPISPTETFRISSDSSGLESWLCEKAEVEPKIGGKYELFWVPTDPENDSTIGCRVTALEQGRLIAFQWRSPRQFKAFANSADPLTHVVVVLHGVKEGTAVTLIHSGWRSSPEWLQAAEWQAVAWDFAFQALADRANVSAL